MCRYSMYPKHIGAPRKSDGRKLHIGWIDGYKFHWACFPCRRSMKSHNGAPICTHCQQPMVCMGRDFKPPRHSAEAQWRKLELMKENNPNAYPLFNSCGCGSSRPEDTPKTLGAAKRDQSTDIAYGRRNRKDRKYLD